MGHHIHERRKQVSRIAVVLGRLYLLQLSLAALFAYISIGEIRSQHNFDVMRDISKVAAIDQVVEHIDSLRKLTWSDLPEYTNADKERDDFEELIAREMDIEDSSDFRQRIFERDLNAAKQKFSQEQIGNSTIVEITMPFATTTVCDVAVFRGNNDVEFELVSSLYFAGIYNVKGNKTALIVFPKQCDPERKSRLSAFLFETSDGVLIGIPHSLFSKIFNDAIYEDLLDVSSVSNDAIRKFLPAHYPRYIDLEGSYQTIALTGLKLQSMQLIQAIQHGRYFPVTQWDQALQVIYDGLKSDNVDLYGFRLAVSDFFNVIPILLFGLSVAYWRKLREIRNPRDAAISRWIGTDTKDYPGLAIAILWAIGPALLFFVVSALYLEANNVVLFVLGYQFTLRFPLSLDVAIGSPPYFYDTDYFGALLSGLVLVYVVLIFVVVKSSWKIVWLNCPINPIADLKASGTAIKGQFLKLTGLPAKMIERWRH